METITAPAPSWAVFCGYAGGLLLACLPALIELVVGEFILLLPIALVLTLAALWPLRGSVTHRVFVCALVAALVTETFEQVLFPDQVPRWADIAPPVLFTIAGIALLLTARGESRRGGTALDTTTSSPA